MLHADLQEERSAAQRQGPAGEGAVLFPAQDSVVGHPLILEYRECLGLVVARHTTKVAVVTHAQNRSAIEAPSPLRITG